MPDVPHSLSGSVRKNWKRHKAVMPRGMPDAAPHTVSEDPSRTQRIVETSGRSLRTEFPWRSCAPNEPRRNRSPKHEEPAEEQPASHYLISTLAPASSNFFLMLAASSLLTPSLTVLGAPSTRSLASLRPRLVTSRTALMTLILLPPMSVRTTVNSVFSSAGAAAAAAPPLAATTVAAAAESPKASSIFLTRSDASRSVRPLISSRIVSTFDMTAISPLNILNQTFRNRGGRGPLSPKPLRTKFVGLDRFADGHGKIAGQHVERGRDPLSRSVQEEHDLADQFILGRHGGKLLDFRDGDHSAFHHAGLESERRNFLGDLGEGLGKGHRVGFRVGDGISALQVFEHALGGRAGAGKFREGVLYDLILATGSLHGAAELGVGFDCDALEGGENYGGHLRELGFQLVQILLLFAFLLHCSRSPLISLRATRRLPGFRPRRYPRGCPDPWSKSE